MNDNKTCIEADVSPVEVELNRISNNNHQIRSLGEGISDLRKRLESLLQNHLVMRDFLPETPPTDALPVTKDTTPETPFVARLREIRKEGIDRVDEAWAGIRDINRLLDAVIIP